MRHADLDPRTLAVIAVCVALVSTAVAALVWKTRQTTPGFGRWTLGNLCGSLSLLFLSLRGFAPDWVSIILANAAALGSGTLYFQGARKFRGLPQLWWPECSVGVLGLAAVVYFRYATDDITARTVAWSLAIGCLGLGCGITFLTGMPKNSRFSRAFTGTIFAQTGAVMLARGFYTYAYHPNHGLFAPSAFNSLVFAGAGLVAVGWTFGFVLMTGEWLLKDVREASVRDIAAAQAMAIEGPTLSGPVPELEVRRQVEKITASEFFRKAARMERFLSLAVDRALLGQPEKLKEYALGRDVFNRGEDYDPRVDSIVRVEAQRLRRKLREYYESYGKTDLVIIDFPPGSYVPVFRYRRPESETSKTNAAQS